MTFTLFIAWITFYMAGSAAVNGRGHLDADTSVVVTVFGLMVVAFAICNLVLGLWLTAGAC